MSDSGFSNLSSSTARRADRFPAGKEGDLNSRILEVSGQLRELRQTTRVAGKVAARNADNSVEIETSQGNVKVRIPRDERVPDRGEDVEVELAAGKPPRKARVDQPAQQQNSEQTASSNQSSAPSQGQAASNSPAEYKPVQQTQNNTPPPPALNGASVSINSQQPVTRASTLEADTTVRLTPLTSNQLENITNGVTQITAAKLQVTNFALTTIQQNQTLELTQSLAPLNVQGETLSQLSKPLAEFTQNSASPLLNLQNIVQNNQIETQSTINNSAALNQSPLQNLLSIVDTDDKAQITPLSNFSASTKVALNLPQPQNASLGQAFETQASLKTIQFLPQGITSEPQSFLAPLTLQISALDNLLSIKSNEITSNLQSLLSSQTNTITNAQITQPLLQTSNSSEAINKPFVDAKITNITAPAAKLFDTSGMQINAAQTIANTASNPDLSINTPLTNSPPSTHTMRAEVIGFTAERNLPVLSFFNAQGSLSDPFSMQFVASNLSQGSQIDLVPSLTQITSQKPLAMMQAAASTLPLFTSLANLQWPALNELNAALQQPALQSTLQSSMQHLPSPSTPSRLPAAALLFIAAVNAGDISGFLNDKTADLLRRSGKGDLLKKIGGDMKSIAKMSTETISQDWRAIPLPMAHQGEIQQIMLYYKKDENNNGDEDGDSKSGTRFLFNLSLNKMGPVQLDGYHKSERLDLIVRMETKPTSDMQQAMHRVYINALEQAGTVGELSFQSKTDQWIEIQDDQENTFYHA